MNNIYKSIEEYYPNNKRKILIVFYDMTANMLSNKKLNSVVTKLFIIDRVLNIFLVLIKESYFPGPKIIKLNFMHHVIRKIPNK